MKVNIIGILTIPQRIRNRLSNDKPNEKELREHFERLMKDYQSGKKGVQPGHPKEVEEAIHTFLQVSMMLIEYPELDTIPIEYVDKLLETLVKYPEYNNLTMDLCRMLDVEVKRK